MQVFFTIGLAIVFAGERVRGFQWLALLLAAGGIALIALHSGPDSTPVGLGLVLAAAFAWAIGNHVARRSGGGVDMFGYVVWSSLFALPPLVLLSLAFEGWPAVSAALVRADARTWAAVLWQAAGNTLFGFAAWAWLLARHPAATVAPLALLVPVFGMAASALWLGEALPPWKLVAAAMVVAGLALNLLWPRLRARLADQSGGA
jgi:O-acetylserine/cysteine efflux transporter